jgi:pilus assembly protein Flp/PilA
VERVAKPATLAGSIIVITGKRPRGIVVSWQDAPQSVSDFRSILLGPRLVDAADLAFIAPLTMDTLPSPVTVLCAKQERPERPGESNHQPRRKEVRSMLPRWREPGQGLVEYALILMLVAVVVIVVLMILGPAIGNTFSNVVSNI